MANTQKHELLFSFVYEFTDGDTRTLSVENPNISTVTPANAENVRTKLNTFGAINIGDKTGAAFSRTKSAYVEERDTTTLDLSQ